MAFISCRSRLIKVLAGAAREEKGSKYRVGRVRLPHVDMGRLSGLKYKLICCFKLEAYMVWDRIKVLVNYTDGPAFFERELMGLVVDGY